MTNWYVSTVAYAAVQTWNSLTGGLATSVSSGKIVRQTSPTAGNERCFRCTTAGTTSTTEPTWNLGNNATTTDGSVTWTECAGQEAHQHDNGVSTSWACPFKLLGTAIGFISAGDTIFISSDHNESQASNYTLAPGNTTRTISVSRAGSVPPVAADITPGAQVATTSTGQLTISNNCSAYYEGVYFTAGSGGTGAGFYFDQSGNQHNIYLKNCKIGLGTTVSDAFHLNNNGGSCQIVLDNTPMVLNATGHFFSVRGGILIWRNTPSGVQGTAPTVLIAPGANGLSSQVDISGVDLSGLGSGSIVQVGNSPISTYTIRNCKLGSSFTTIQNSIAFWTERLEMVNCDSANTNYHNEWYSVRGSVKTETSVTRSGGASDGTTAASRKMVSLSGTSGTALPLDTLDHRIFFWFSGSTGSSHTATVEIISSGSLNNDDIWGEVEYLGDSTDPTSSLANCGLATTLTTHAAQTSSSVTWNNPPATPQKQKLVVTFTPQQVGLCVFRVRLAKASTTVYVDHVVTVA